MGLQLSSFFRFDNQNTVIQNTQTANTDGTSGLRMSDAGKNLTVGQTVSGEVLSVRDGEIDIALDKEHYITAKLQQGMDVAVGQLLTLEVKSTSGNRISLMPLYENMAKNPTIQNAVNAAQIPLNNRSAGMVEAMMNEGMPIDKESLQNMYRQVANHPEVSGNTIVQMNRLQIPVTPENVSQFEMYKNYEHSLKEGVQTVADDLGKAFLEVVQNGNTEESVDFFSKLVQTFKNSIEESVTGQGQNLTQNEYLNGSIPETENKTETEFANQTDLITKENKIMEEQVQEKQTVLITKEEGEKISGQEQQAGTERLEEYKPVLGFSAAQAAVFADKLQQIGASPQLLETFKEGTISVEELLQNVEQLLQKDDKPKDSVIKDFLGSKELSQMLKGQITKQWMIQPEEVAKEGKVEELYKRIQQQTAKLMESMTSFAKDNSPLMKSVTNLSSNVEFMNQLNQAFTYVQLPLKMTDGNAHGELYVYTNKKNLAKKDGNVSALLHLDMEHLGMMDIYVAMQQNKVNTKFYLEKEEYIDFIAENIYLLDERLKKRGYTMTADVQQREKKTNVIEEMIHEEKNQGFGNSLISKFAFDARA